MPIVASSNGVRPEIRALAVFKLNKPVTPQQINDCVGTGDYAAKYVSFLNTRYGFTITAQKDGRRVVSYTMIAEPKNAAELRGMKPKTTKATPAPKAAPKAKTVTVAPVKTEKSKTATSAKAAAAKVVKPKKVKIDPVEKQFGSTGEIATSYSLDPDWDAVDNTSLPDFLR